MRLTQPNEEKLLNACEQISCAVLPVPMLSILQ